MQTTETITIEIHNAIPNGGIDATGKIISLWQLVDGYFTDRKFVVEDPYRGQLGEYRISLDAKALINLMQTARDNNESFDIYRQMHAADSSVAINSELHMTVEALNSRTEPYSMYHAASVFIQQLLLGMNLALPGSCQFLDTRFAGPHAHRFEAQDFDSKAFSDAMLSATEHGWPKLHELSFETVWGWFERAGTSERNTAITTINKVLIDMLKIAQQRYRYGARTAMLVGNQLEMLVGTSDDADMQHLRERVSLILGRPPESADCFKELYRLREALFKGEHPVRRPALVYHNADEEIMQQLAQHNSGVEKALAVVLSLLQDLVQNDADGYQFSEHMQRKGQD
ncbi:hypothetical protein [Hahella ganghwensis]|uniref:hypothetical protein n=1 Tax=Hahella ganghwensis TaxID=286420 RepID=UPI0003751D7D|nr:hypothetical protein [Hahella ganghwensis]